LSANAQKNEHHLRAQNPTVDLDVLYEDDTFLVVNKPHRLLSVATDRLEVDTLSQSLR